MYKLTTEMIEYLSELLQAGKAAPACKVTVYRKNKDLTFEPFPFILPEVTRITLDRRWNMNSDRLEVEMANLNGFYSPEYSIQKQYPNVKDLPHSGYTNVLTAFSKVECDLGYGDSLVRMFTGQIQNVNSVELPPTIKFNALNSFRKLLKPIDPITTHELVYEGQTAFSIVKDLCERAGVTDLLFDHETVNGYDFSINRITCPLGMNYIDAIKSILDIMNHRITGGRHGEIQVVKNEIYSQQDFQNWDFDDYANLSEGEYNFDSALLRNRLIVMSENGWQAFEDPLLLDCCNGERISTGLEVEWAETLEQKWAVADHFFLSVRRRMRRLSVAIRGNPSMDIGDLVRARMLTSAVDDKYMITAIQSEFSEGGYIDVVDLEYVDTATDHLCVPAEGAYAAAEGGGASESGLSTLALSLRDRIVDEAKKYLGVYYEWGGNYPESGYGLDCSHFTYQVLKAFGLMDAYKTAAGQKDWTLAITRDDLLPGDLLFYTNSAGKVRHVTMYIGNGQIIGANGGDSKTTTKAIAKSKNACVKVQGIDYESAAFYGRVPGLA